MTNWSLAGLLLLLLLGQSYTNCNGLSSEATSQALQYRSYNDEILPFYSDKNPSCTLTYDVPPNLPVYGGSQNCPACSDLNYPPEYSGSDCGSPRYYGNNEEENQSYQDLLKLIFKKSGIFVAPK